MYMRQEIQNESEVYREKKSNEESEWPQRRDDKGWYPRKSSPCPALGETSPALTQRVHSAGRVGGRGGIANAPRVDVAGGFSGVAYSNDLVRFRR